MTSPPNLEGWDGPSGDSHANPSPHIPALLEQEDLGLGDSWSRCCGGGGPLGKQRQPCLSSHPKW